MASLRAELTALKRRIPPPMAPVDASLAADPVLLAERVGLMLDPWQAGLMRSRDPQMILLCSRQSGKSTVSGLIALHEAQYRRPALVLILSPSLRQSGELFAKIKAAHTALGPDALPLTRETADTLVLVNGSRIVCLPSSEATVRGFSGVTLLIVDEASRVMDTLYQAVRPMLAVSGGRIVLLSTPWGRRGFFHHEWTEGVDWKRVKVRAEDCPRIPRDWLERERAAIGDWWYSQEYGCEFVDTEDSVFAYDFITGAVDSTVAPLFAGGLA